jgi:AT hook motif
MGRFLRYADLVERGLFRNRQSLKNWQDKYGFPQGRLVGNTRLWDWETEIKPWLESQPTAPARTPKPKRPRGRPRKVEAEQSQLTE